MPLVELVRNYAQHTWWRLFGKKTPVETGSVKEIVDNLIASKKVVVFSKSYCPFCHKAKTVLQSFNLSPQNIEWVDIENRSDCNEIQDYLMELTGARSVPRVFIDGKFFGGGDETAAANTDGTLEMRLKEVGALVQ